MSDKKGSLSVEADNIFPILKKWMYSEQDIFFRELISNGADAITKVKRLIAAGAVSDPEYSGEIEVRIDTTDRTIHFIDNGIGMTAEEVDQYINRIAFSGAKEFLKNYENQEDSAQIIGHFGLGFYSAFLVADKVTIDSLSLLGEEDPVYWECDSNMHFDMTKGTRDTVGSEITLYVGNEYRSYLSANGAKKIIEKYFANFPIPILLTQIVENKEGEVETITQQVNETHPLWMKHPVECSREEYLEFYSKNFEDPWEPAFWLHIYNEDAGVKGIYYFRKKESQEQALDGLVKIYSNQVFVADNVKELLPDCFQIQYGVFDIKDLPLNVSRSALQSDSRVKELSAFLIQQIAFKLHGMFTFERSYYEEFWPDLNAFVKYACIRNRTFASIMANQIIFETIYGNYQTLQEYLDETDKKHKDAEDGEKLQDNSVFYVSDEIQQVRYIKLFKQAGLNALMMTQVVDAPFMQQQESMKQKRIFTRIDSDFSQEFQESLTEEETQDLAQNESDLKALFRRYDIAQDIRIKAVKMIDANISSLMILDENTRRVRDTIELYGAARFDLEEIPPVEETLLINVDSVLVRYILDHQDEQISEIFCRQLLDLAMLGQESLEAEGLADFIERSDLVMEQFCGLLGNK